MLEKNNVAVQVFSMKRPEKKLMHAEARCFFAKTRYMDLGRNLYPVLMAHLLTLLFSPLKYIKLCFIVLRPSPYNGKGARFVLRSAAQFVRGVYLARIIGSRSGFCRIHAQFAEGSSTSAWVASELTGLPFSFTAHAYDIFCLPQLLEEKIRSASFVATISEYNRRFLSEFSNCGGKKIHLIRAGVNTGLFVSAGKREEEMPPVILCVAQLVEKKGHMVLLEACRLMAQKGIDFRCILVGDGPRRRAIENIISSYCLPGKIILKGVLRQEEILPLYNRASVFVLPSVLARDGDRDGIPVALMEAMAAGLPVISSDISGIGELVENGITGLTVESGNSRQLAEAIERLINDPGLRLQLSRNALGKVKAEYDMEKNTKRLVTLLQCG